MTKVHPNSPSIESPPPSPSPSPAVREEKEETMTVWRKSLLFNCRGFTVYDSNGDLVFRVDNYSTRSKREIVLMDAIGLPLFTIRRKRLSLGEKWLIYDGDQRQDARFSVTKHVTVRSSKWLAHVTPCDGSAQGPNGYAVEGSYKHRRCTVYDERRRAVAEVQRKDAVAPGVTLGGDVFRLVVQPGLQAQLAMAIVVLLDQMFGS